MSTTYPKYDPNRFSPLKYHTSVSSFRDGSDTPRHYLERCLETISEREPIVQAWVVLNEHAAREQADASGRRWRTGRPLSQIDGMPIGIKDLLETKDMPTQMGCVGLQGNFPKRDNAAVWALRQAGAVILGKTVTAELGGSQPGPTTNPFNHKHTPGGSSSGSAAAVGAAMIPAAIGTQVGGSIIRPASYCGNFALKPTHGALNRGERQTSSMSAHGPHAGCLEDMWHVAMEIARRAGGDPGMPVMEGPRELPSAHRPRVLAVMETEGWRDVDGATRAAFDDVLGQLVQSGVVVVRRRDSDSLEQFEKALVGVRQLTLDITAWENQWFLRNLLMQNPEAVSIRARSGVEIAERIGVDGYQERIERRAQVRAKFGELSSHIDAVISLAAPGPAPLAVVETAGQSAAPFPTGDPTFNTPSSLLGAPVVSLPLLSVRGLPVGIQVMGQQGSDAVITAVARWLDQSVKPVVVKA